VSFRIAWKSSADKPKSQNRISSLEEDITKSSHSPSTQETIVASGGSDDIVSREKPIAVAITNAPPSYDGVSLKRLAGMRENFRIVEAAAKVCQCSCDRNPRLMSNFVWYRRREISYGMDGFVVDTANYRASLPLSRYFSQHLLHWGDTCDDIYVMRPIQRMQINAGIVSQPGDIPTHSLQEVLTTPMEGTRYYLGVYEFAQEEIVHGVVYHSLPASV
jgi:hypothetical protein